MKTVTAGMIILMALCLPLTGLAQEMETRSGMVVMGKHTQKYTFILIEEDNNQHWLAANFIDIAPGDIIEYIGGIEMRNFYSPAMQHTFEEIILVTNIRITEQVALPGDTAELPKKPAIATEAAIPATPLMQKNGQLSVAELFANREDLAGQTVSLAAKVIRVSRNIQGKNWFALADGTGTAPDDQIMAMTTEQVNLGDMVTATGVLSSDKTVGMGHAFKVLLEDATFKVDKTPTPAR